MQNFQLSTSFKITADQLDKRRLGKQRLETADALAMLLGQPAWMSDKQYAYIQKKYRNHPAWRMWRGYEAALIDYGLTICEEWQSRGCKDTFYDKIGVFVDKLDVPSLGVYLNPPWLTEELCANHRSILLGKVKESVKQAALNLNINWGEGEHCEIIQDKEYTKFKKEREIATWYHNLGWKEKPAKRVLINGKMRWPYIWPGEERRS